jgi:hypothetical protein
MTAQAQTPMHPNNMTDKELINNVYMGSPTNLERALASRLELALEYIERAHDVLRINDLLDESGPVYIH